MTEPATIIDPVLKRPIPLALALEAERQRAAFFEKWVGQLLDEKKGD